MPLPVGPRLPAIVQSAWYFAAPDAFFRRAARRYGTPCTVCVLGETWVLLDDPVAIAEVFTASPETLRSGDANALLRPIFGSGSVLLLDGDEHLERRRALLPFFHGKSIAGYRDVVAEVTRGAIERWPVGRRFALLPSLQQLTLEVILRAVLGVEGRHGQRAGELLRDLLRWTGAQHNMLAMGALGPDRTARLRRFRRVLAPADAELAALIRERRADPSSRERSDILSCLVSHTDLNDGEVRDELVTLLLAGHETTAGSLAWAFEALMHDPEAWRRLRAGEPGWAEAVAREALRLRPPVPHVVRRLMAPMTIGGAELPAGITVAPCANLVHRREDLYPDPDAFRPQRFLGVTPGTYTWLPFGGGTRRCLGQALAMLEMTTVLETVANHATLQPASPRREHARRRFTVLVPSRGALVVRT
jgi:cytochrome P450 family 135